MVSIIFVGICLHINKVNNTANILFEADREMNRKSILTQALMNRLKRLVEIAANLIDFIDKTDTRYTIFIGLTPDGFRLSLDAHLAIKYNYSAVEHAKRTLDLGGKVDVAWCIDNVDFVTFPVSSHSSGGNCNTALFFLFHPVGGSTAGIALNEVDFVLEASTIKNSLRCSGFTSIDMGDNADVAILR